jgi:uncharacterized phage protein (TIGR01671 family)
MLNWDKFEDYMFNNILSDEPYFIVMQYTGLTDKNGKEIYEEDICKGWCKEQQKDGGYELVEQVYGGRGGFTLFGKPMQEFTTQDDNLSIRNLMWCDRGHFATPDTYWEIKDVEIIGNIYENPELLTKKD